MNREEFWPGKTDESGVKWVTEEEMMTRVKKLEDAAKLDGIIRVGLCIILLVCAVGLMVKP